MKALCLILLLALSSPPACSHFTASGRQKRVYAKHLKKRQIALEKRKARLRHPRKVPPPEFMAPPEPQEATPMTESSQLLQSDSINQ